MVYSLEQVSKDTVSKNGKMKLAMDQFESTENEELGNEPMGLERRRLPASIGIDIGDTVVEALPQGCLLPATETVYVTTKFDLQPTALIKVYAGKRPKAADNILLLKRKFEGISIAERYEPRIQVTITVTGDAYLCVSAEENSRCLGLSRVLLNLEGLAEEVGEMDRFWKKDSKERRRIDVRLAFEDLCIDLTNIFKVRLASRCSDDPEIPTILQKIRTALDWINMNSGASEVAIIERRHELEYAVFPKIQFLLDANIIDDFGNVTADTKRSACDAADVDFDEECQAAPSCAGDVSPNHFSWQVNEQGRRESANYISDDVIGEKNEAVAPYSADAPPDQIMLWQANSSADNLFSEHTLSDRTSKENVSVTLQIFNGVASMDLTFNNPITSDTEAGGKVDVLAESPPSPVQAKLCLTGDKTLEPEPEFILAALDPFSAPE